MKKLLLAPLKLLSFLFGQFSWSPPIWLVACFSFFRKHIKITLGLICAVMITVGINHYIQSLPKPISTKAEFSEISLSSPSSRTGTESPSKLYVNFIYDLDALHEDYLISITLFLLLN